MTSKIRVLNDTIVNQIAAGEVIENSASVVKELVENSLDAGATEITIEIKSGGRYLIQVSDNGCGMSKDDALLCLERHATSKIRNFDDLEQLHSMGFRGEAIPSIASISKFTLNTSTNQGDHSEATLVVVDGGKIIRCGPSIRSQGTTIEAKSLFFNVPARKKFQKSPNYDVTEIHKVIIAFALGYPYISFELISDSKVLLKTINSSTEDESELLQERAKEILGEEFFSSTLPIRIDHSEYQLTGFIGKPSYHRSNRVGQYLFINRRHVYSPLIASSIRGGYGPALPTNRFPYFLIHLTVPGSLIDVNVHPQKREVRLRKEFLIKELLHQAVKEALVGSMHFINSPIVEPFIPTPISMKTVDKPPWEASKDEHTAINASSFEAVFLANNTHRTTVPPIPQKEEMSLLRQTTEQKIPDLLSVKPTFQIPRILAIMPRYILVDATTVPKSENSSQEGFCVIDQYAAHFRLLYEQFFQCMHHSSSKNMQEIQPLLIPYTLELTAVDAHIAKIYMKPLQSLGIGIQEFGQNTFMIDAIPQDLEANGLHATIVDLLHELRESEQGRMISQEREKRLVQSVSRAVMTKKNQKLSIEMAQQLINRLIQCQQPFHCPMGKPTMIWITPQDLSKQFF